ncbi:MAG TPA: homoserine O-acetyltransferase [Chitinophagales bacterium]|nr:homoserine O-acetyltransferase [Chitinophagales bacterium]HMU97668.1 homoserine O-acetyltransferase [Chitinophagales bacterium]HMV01922.1 homoserine O-acetyltransferase [Chitinophagales bacterium]HMW93860.1 homoserine O-acetyltransferase [Chitinophagales bacterium]HMY42068.1 homoserine O-acetyltransferase [Chitinophagales bacterium]
MEPNILKYKAPFPLESGTILPEIDIAYNTFGTLNADKSNVVWICHAFSANSNPTEWWPGMVGDGLFFDPKDYFIVCANMLGSCYGSTGPLSINPETGKKYYKDFPVVTVRDMVKSLTILRKHLGIEKIYFSCGFSMGGQQLLEWIITEPTIFKNILLGATNIKHSPWGIAFNESQRMAIEADGTFGQEDDNAGINGMKAARSIGLISYRNYKAYNITQHDEDNSKLENFKACGYQRYQGEKLAKRFNAYSYYILSKAMDNHNIERGRGAAKEVLENIKSNIIVLGIKSDFLYPLEEQELMASLMPHSTFVAIDSHFGHDGFLIENEQISKILSTFLKA